MCGSPGSYLNEWRPSAELEEMVKNREQQSGPWGPGFVSLLWHITSLLKNPNFMFKKTKQKWVPGERPMRERLVSVLFPFILKWAGMELRMASRYFSCSRLLDESEDEAGAEGKTQQQKSRTFLLFGETRFVCSSARRHTVWGRVLRLKQSHHTLAVEAPRAQQHGFGPGMLPAHDRQTVVSVAASYFVQTAVLHTLRNHQQSWVAERRPRSKISQT